MRSKLAQQDTSCVCARAAMASFILSEFVAAFHCDTERLGFPSLSPPAVLVMLWSQYFLTNTYLDLRQNAEVQHFFLVHISYINLL